MLLAAFSATDARGGDHSKIGAFGGEVRTRPGVYYPGPYYSLSYKQAFPLRPGQQPIMYWLAPFQHYGEIRYGQPVPGLTRGYPNSDYFPYRYAFDFQPNALPPAPPQDPCAGERPIFSRTPSPPQPGN